MAAMAGVSGAPFAANCAFVPGNGKSRGGAIARAVMKSVQQKPAAVVQKEEQLIVPEEEQLIVHKEEQLIVRRINNQADELLENWARQPTTASRNSETEAVRRLFLWDELPKKDEVQLFSIYEINERDRDSPAFLPFSTINISKTSTSPKHDNGLMDGLLNLWSTLSGSHEHGLGDIVPFTNKIYDSSLRVRLGVTAGLMTLVKAYPGKGQRHQTKHDLFFPDRYEAMYTFYMGDMGHLSAQGQFCTFEDTLLTITGGAGLFREARGVIHLHNLTPVKIFYEFHVRGIPELPSVLTSSSPVPPSQHVQPCHEAALCKPGFTLPNYSD